MKKSYINNLTSDYASYLSLERGLSKNSVSAYCSDIEKFLHFLGIAGENGGKIDVQRVDKTVLEDFIASEQQRGLSVKSQARLISSLKSFYEFLVIEKLCENSPAELLEQPKPRRALPVVLSVREVTDIIDSVDLSQPEGPRNRAILEVLYSCGLRVSELINLRLSDIFINDGFVRVTGKGDKQRLVPLGEPASESILNYLEIRSLMPIAVKHADFLFLNRRGHKLTREMIFHIVRKQTLSAGIEKEVSPHTFRHSFATHMVENGADLRVVQEMLGHSSILTTEIYMHVNSEKWRRSIIDHHPRGKASIV